jgi:hypothetical protein
VRAVCHVFAFLLVVGLSGGSALLDGCLASCYPETAAKNARTGHCHTLPGSAGGAHLEEIAPCCHDSTSGQTNTANGQYKLIARSFILMAAIGVHGRDPFARHRFMFVAHADVFSVIDSRLIPLRV